MPKPKEPSIERFLIDSHQFKTMEDTDEIYYYDENRGVYLARGETIIKTQVESITDGKITTHGVNEIMNHIRRQTATYRYQFDSDPNILNLQNGLLNIETGDFKEHSHEDLSLFQLPVIYDPNAKCPNILKFLGQVLHPQDVFTAMQVIGYCLYKSAEYEKAVMLVGPGLNGKGVFIKVIEALVGRQNCSHVTLQELDTDRFSSADLYCKMVNTFADLKADKLSSTGMFKTLVSGDTIRAQYKHRDAFSFRNYAKLVYSTNKIPETEDKSFAYYRRWLILMFEKVFDDTLKDTKLIHKLTTPEELSGLLNLALIGLKQLHKDGGFKDISVEKVRKIYDRNSNTVNAFLHEKCIIDLDAPEYYALTTDVYNEYVLFCKAKTEQPLEMNVFGKKLAELGIEKERVEYFHQKSNCYVGIKLKPGVGRGVNSIVN
jgi:putative DNA primase/helicase